MAADCRKHTPHGQHETVVSGWGRTFSWTTHQSDCPSYWHFSMCTSPSICCTLMSFSFFSFFCLYPFSLKIKVLGNLIVGVRNPRRKGLLLLSWMLVIIRMETALHLCTTFCLRRITSLSMPLVNVSHHHPRNVSLECLVWLWQADRQANSVMER